MRETVLKPSPTPATLLQAAITRLRAAGVPGPARDARLLLAHALGIAPDRLTLALAEPTPEEAGERFHALVERRAARQPVSQIIGARLFWGRRFKVTPDVLDPRPETEILIAEALAEPFARVLDLGTGSGAILLTLLAERPGARGLGVDISPAALEVARANAQALGVAARAELRLSDWFADVTGRFDLIAANPPYITRAEMAALAPETRDWEPHLALTPGGDGLAAYRAIAACCGAHLSPGGRLLVEIGPDQADAVCALFTASGLAAPRVLRDMDNRPRLVAVRAG
ncbi:MAG: peptide chain release factor N(5)-glutamine methyltransferase [Pararhodobacter sp.]|nr:peptide chain release factor N(5)-glutamine methyltransferase [Pararhodobacter sp.]